MTRLLIPLAAFACGLALQAQAHRAPARPLPVAWSNFGTCSAELLGDDVVRWTCRIDKD